MGEKFIIGGLNNIFFLDTDTLNVNKQVEHQGTNLNKMIRFGDDFLLCGFWTSNKQMLININDPSKIFYSQDIGKVEDILQLEPSIFAISYPYHDKVRIVKVETNSFTIMNTISFTDRPYSLYKISDSLLLVGFTNSKLKVVDMRNSQVINEIPVEGGCLYSIKAIKSDVLLVKTEK